MEIWSFPCWGKPPTVSIVGGVGFLIVGAGVAYLLATSCSNPRQLFVRPHFSEWNYRPQDKIDFRLERDTLDPTELLCARKKAILIDVYVAARWRKGEILGGNMTWSFCPFPHSTGVLIENL